MAYREGKLSQLPLEKQLEIVELARRARLMDVVQSLNEQGVEISLSGVSRFVKKVEERRLVEEAKEESEAMEALAAGRDRRKFRKGTLAMLQSRLYEEALRSGDLEVIQKCYQQLAAEEDRAEGLEMDRRRLELAAVNAEVGRRRLEIALESGKGRRRASDCGMQISDGLPKPFQFVAQHRRSLREAKCGSEGNTEEKPEERLLTEANPAVAGQAKGNEEVTEKLRRHDELAEALRSVKEALDRGGDAAGKVLEARALLEGK